MPRPRFCSCRASSLCCRWPVTFRGPWLVSPRWPGNSVQSDELQHTDAPKPDIGPRRCSRGRGLRPDARPRQLSPAGSLSGAATSVLGLQPQSHLRQSRTGPLRPWAPISSCPRMFGETTHPGPVLSGSFCFPQLVAKAHCAGQFFQDTLHVVQSAIESRSSACVDCITDALPDGVLQVPDIRPGSSQSLSGFGLVFGTTCHDIRKHHAQCLILFHCSVPSARIMQQLDTLDQPNGAFYIYRLQMAFDAVVGGDSRRSRGPRRGSRAPRYDDGGDQSNGGYSRSRYAGPAAGVC